MTIPSVGIADILIAANLGIMPVATMAVNAWPIYSGQLPTARDQAIAVIDRPGLMPEVKVAIDYPSVQLLIRSSRVGYIAARTKAEELFNALQAIPDGGAHFPELTSCVASTGIVFAGFDPSERPVHSLNFNLIVSHPAPVGYRDL
jgi:hypothetical protein